MKKKEEKKNLSFGIVFCNQTTIITSWISATLSSSQLHQKLNNFCFLKKCLNFFFFCYFNNWLVYESFRSSQYEEVVDYKFERFSFFHFENFILFFFFLVEKDKKKYIQVTQPVIGHFFQCILCVYVFV